MSAPPLMKRVSRFLSQHDYVRRVLWALLICVLYILIVVPTFISYDISSTMKQVEVDRPPRQADTTKLQQRANETGKSIPQLVLDNDPVISTATDYVDILLRATGADFANSVLKVRAAFMPIGKLGDSNSDITQKDLSALVDSTLNKGDYDIDNVSRPAALLKPVTVVIGTTTIKFDGNKIMETRDVQIPFLSGIQTDYPGDMYPSTVYITAFSESGNGTSRVVTPIPFHATFRGAVQGIHFRSYVLADAVTDTSFYIRTRRTTTTIVFSIFITLLMWLITLGLGSLWLQLVVHGREIAPPHLSIGIALLFAMPGLRATQPNIPTVGVASDLLGFTWNIILISLFTVSIIVTYVYRWTRPKPVSEPSVPAVVAPEPLPMQDIALAPANNKQPYP